LAIIFTLLLCPGLLQAAGGKATLRISGSSTLLPVTQTAAEEYLKGRPDLLLTVSGTGTGEGIRSLIDGNVDIADASREIKEEEARRAREADVSLERHDVALDCLAVIVHPSNPVEDITMDDLRGVYEGTIVNWSQLGGPDLVIVPINRDSSSGTFEMWVEEVLGGGRHRPDAQVQSSSGGVAYAVSGNRYALGYVSLGFLSPQVKALAVNGVRPSRQTASDGSYPIKRGLYMYARGDHGPEVDRFLEFVFSEAGREIIERIGFLPPPGDGVAAQGTGRPAEDGPAGGGMPGPGAGKEAGPGVGR
jgi:phosphate transport system substrate-binding protein